MPLFRRTEKSPGRKLPPGGSDCRKTYITKKVVRPTPINPQKAATCAWLFALLKGQVCAKGVHTAPCKNSKKWPKPLFRHAHPPGGNFLPGDVLLSFFFCEGNRSALIFFKLPDALANQVKDLSVHGTALVFCYIFQLSMKFRVNFDAQVFVLFVAHGITIKSYLVFSIF